MAVKIQETEPETQTTQTNQTIELDVRLTPEMQAQFDSPVESVEAPVEFSDNSKRKETGFEEILDK